MTRALCDTAWSMEPLVIPPRSRLYPLQPVGIGTDFVECLTGYMARHAEALSVSFAVLFGNELAPLADKEYLRRAELRSKYKCRIFASAFRPQARAINGLGNGAAEWVRVLQTLTLRDDLRFLTMLPLKTIVPHSQLLRLNRAWCPACYEQWRAGGETVYEPLIWAIKAVTVCHHHSCRLRVECQHCLQPLHILASRSRPGYCSKCVRWLGDAECTALITDELQSGEKLRRELWVSKNIGELIAVAQRQAAQLTRQRIAESFSTCFRRRPKKLAELAETLGIHPTTVWQWMTGKNLPRFDLLLRVCYYLKVPVLDFVTAKVASPLTAPVTTHSAADQNRKPCSHRWRSLNRIQAERVLRAASVEEPPPTLEEAAERLGRDANTLRYHFPDLCAEIVARHLRYKRALLLERGKRIKGVLQHACDKECPPPSMMEIAKRLDIDLSLLRKHHPELYRAISKRYTAYVNTRWQRLEPKLTAALNEEYPPSIRELVGRIGCSASSLYKHFAHLCRRIAQKHAEYRREHLRELRGRLRSKPPAQL